MLDDVDWGFEKNVENVYSIGKHIGRGGSAVVSMAEHRASGRKFAVKTIPKRLEGLGVSDYKRATHKQCVHREVAVLLRLRGTLSVACLESVYEDAAGVHLVLELCSGGGLLACARSGRYGEDWVKHAMRSVLRTLSQCHALGIVHRDIKPDNFMIASPEPDAAVKAIDFGLALEFDAKHLPLTGVHLEGTPWYLAPEACKGRVGPAADVWAAGVMAYQLLCGDLPFGDPISPNRPDLQRVLRAITRSAPSFHGKRWAHVSPQAAAFVQRLLHKEPAMRPSAAQALQDEWLTQPTPANAPTDHSVIQRMQRFGQGGAFRRAALQRMAGVLLAMPSEAVPTSGPAPQRSAHSVARLEEFLRRAGSGEASTHGGRLVRAIAHGLSRSMHGARRGAVAYDASYHGSYDGSYRGSYHGSDPGSRHGAGLVSGTEAGQAAAAVALRLPISTPFARRLRPLYEVFQFCPGAGAAGQVDAEGLGRGLASLGYRLEPGELAHLTHLLGDPANGRIAQAQLAAALLDWPALRTEFPGLWRTAAGRVFADVDADGDGLAGPADIAAFLGGHLPHFEVDAAVAAALTAAHGLPPPAAELAAQDSSTAQPGGTAAPEGAASAGDASQVAATGTVPSTGAAHAPSAAGSHVGAPIAPGVPSGLDYAAFEQLLWCEDELLLDVFEDRSVLGHAARREAAVAAGRVGRVAGAAGCVCF